MTEQEAQSDIRRYIEQIAARDPDSDPKVRYWRVARRCTLLGLLAFSVLQYYVFDVYLTIMALPQLTLIAGLP